MSPLGSARFPNSKLGVCAPEKGSLRSALRTACLQRLCHRRQTPNCGMLALALALAGRDVSIWEIEMSHLASSSDSWYSTRQRHNMGSISFKVGSMGYHGKAVAIMDLSL